MRGDGGKREGEAKRGEMWKTKTSSKDSDELYEMRFSSLLVLCLRNKFSLGNAGSSHKVMLLLFSLWLIAQVPRREWSNAVSTDVVSANPHSPKNYWIFLSLMQVR